MKWWNEIEKQLADPTVRASCIDPITAGYVDLDDSLADFTEQPREASNPLELFDPEDQIDVIKAFATVKIQGTSATEVRLHSGELRHVCFFNEAETLGCYVVLLSAPTGSVSSSTDEHINLKVRTASYRTDTMGLIVWADPDMEPVFGWTPDELVGRSTLNFSHPDEQSQGIASWIDLLERGQGARLRNRRRFRCKDDQWKWIEGTSTNHLDDPDRIAVWTDVIDISEEMAALEDAERREALLTRLTEALPSGVLHLGVDRQPIFWNQRWAELLTPNATSIEGLLGQLAEHSDVADALERSLNSGIDADLDVTIPGADDKGQKYGRLHLRPLQHADGSAELLITIEDTTQAREYQQDLHDLAHSDSLTGVLGRLGSRLIIEDLLASDAPNRALLFIDLDSFKSINDTFGHATGDAVLRAVGEAISSAVREKDSVARVGGDEFIVTVRGMASPAKIVDRIHAALRDAETTIDEPVQIRASIGTASVEPGDTFDCVLLRADEAMYEVKRSRQHRERSIVSPEPSR